jgi:hypothetical protein
MPDRIIKKFRVMTLNFLENFELFFDTVMLRTIEIARIPPDWPEFRRFFRRFSTGIFSGFLVYF